MPADYVRGKWIIELAELSSVSKTEVEHVKAFITRTEEKFQTSLWACRNHLPAPLRVHWNYKPHGLPS